MTTEPRTSLAPPALGLDPVHHIAFPVGADARPAPTGWWPKLDATDRRLYLRWHLGASPSRAARRFWIGITHLGGVLSSVALTLLPLVFGSGTAKVAAAQAAWVLVVSHIVVQIIKRTVVRPRPEGVLRRAALVATPDRYSFPSGHAAAAMSVAVVHAVARPALSAAFLLAAGVVGLSRVRLGVHYPGDVFVGQLAALLTAGVVLSLW